MFCNLNIVESLPKLLSMIDRIILFKGRDCYYFDDLDKKSKILEFSIDAIFSRANIIENLQWG